MPNQQKWDGGQSHADDAVSHRQNPAYFRRWELEIFSPET